MKSNHLEPKLFSNDTRRGWTTFPLASLCNASGGMLKFGVRVPPKEIADMGDHKRTLPVLGTPVRAEFAAKNAHFALRAGDLVCNRRGDLTHRVYVESDNKEVIANNDCLLVRLSDSALSTHYLYYYLEHRQVTRWLQRCSTGKVTPQLNKSLFGALPIIYPDFKVQREFCDTLIAIDRKIKLNQEINATLDEKAHALLIESLSGQSEVRTCSELCSRLENGRTPLKSEPTYWSPPTIPWITSTEVRQGIILQAMQSISTEGLNRTYMKTWPKGAIIVALCGQTAGKVARLAFTTSGNQACCALMPRPGFEDYLYVYLRNAGNALSRLCKGTAFRSLNQKILADFPITTPSPARLEEFNNMVKPLLAKLEQNLRQTMELQALREKLLEKLIPL